MKILYSLIYCYEHDIIDGAVHPIMNSDHDVTLKINLLSSDPKHFLKCKSLASQYDQNSILELHRENNQSARLNDALIYGYDICDYDAVIFGEPGVHFKSSEEFNFFIKKAEPLLDKKFAIASKTCEEDDVFAAFQFITKLGWENIGCWYENLFLSTNENDWCMRAFRSSGSSLDWLEIITTNSHHIGKWFRPPDSQVSDWVNEKRKIAHPATQLYENIGIHQAVQHHNNIKNGYLMKKWNSIFSTQNSWDAPQVFKYPFNNPNISFKIDPSNRMLPYPGHNREDRADSYFRIFDKPYE